MDRTAPALTDDAPSVPFGFAPPTGVPTPVAALLSPQDSAPSTASAPPAAVLAGPPAPVPQVPAEAPTVALVPSVIDPTVAEASLLPPGSEAEATGLEATGLEVTGLEVTGIEVTGPADSIYLSLAARVESIESLLASTAVTAAVPVAIGDPLPVDLAADLELSAGPEPVRPMADVQAVAPAVPATPAEPTSIAPPQSSFGGTIRTLVIVALLAVAGIVATRGTGGETKAPTVATGVSDGELMVIASDITVAIQQDAATTNASSAYVRESGVVLMVTTSGLLPSEMSAWLDSLITPFAERLGGLPEGEGVLVAMHFSDAPGFDRLVRMEAAGITDPASWVTVPITGGLPESMVTNGTTDGTTDGATGTTVAAQESTQTTVVTDDSSPTTTAPTVAPTTTAGSGAAAEGSAGGDVVSDDFANGDGQWKSLAGTWAVVDGVYQQSDGLGFDLITRLDKTVPAAYQFEVRMRGIGGAPLNAGVILAQANPSTREGAVVIDLTDNGGYVRWGKYAAVGGAYEFIGGAALATPLDPAEWHSLKVIVKGETTIVYIDDQQIGDAGLVGAGGVGLVVSQSTVEFDDVKVSAV